MQPNDEFVVSDENPADNVGIDKENAERVAMHQVALAGYRLADLLNSIFDPKP